MEKMRRLISILLVAVLALSPTAMLAEEAAEEAAAPVEEAVVIEESAVEEPAAEEPAAEEAAEAPAEEAVAEEPAAEEPAAEEPAAEEPAAEEAAAEEPAAEEPAAEEAVEEIVFSASFKLELLNAKALELGDVASVHAVVNDANMGYRLTWERKVVKDGKEVWEEVASGELFNLDVTVENIKAQFRCVLTADDGTKLVAGYRLPASLLPEEPAAEEPVVEEPAIEEAAVEEPAVEEPAVEEPAVEEEVETEIIDVKPVEKTVKKAPAQAAAVAEEAPAAEAPVFTFAPAPETEEIEEYETPLGLDEIQTITLAGNEEEVNVREDADGMSAIFTSLTEGAEVTVVNIEDDWATVVIDDQQGYIYVDDIADLLDLPEAGPAEEIEKKVTIFTSRRTVMTEGEPVYLTSKLVGFEDCEEIAYAWKVDKGNGFEYVEGANEPTYSFTANAETLSWAWKLEVQYR